VLRLKIWHHLPSDRPPCKRKISNDDFVELRVTMEYHKNIYGVSIWWIQCLECKSSSWHTPYPLCFHRIHVNSSDQENKNFGHGDWQWRFFQRTITIHCLRQYFSISPLCQKDSHRLDVVLSTFARRRRTIWEIWELGKERVSKYYAS